MRKITKIQEIKKLRKKRMRGTMDSDRKIEDTQWTIQTKNRSKFFNEKSSEKLWIPKSINKNPKRFR